MEPLVVREDSFEQRLRERQGYTDIVSVDATAFKDRYERDHNQPLAWSTTRSERLLKASVIDSYHKVGYSSETGRIGVLDGRHRIAEAARRGQRIDVAVDPKYPLPDDVDPRSSNQSPKSIETDESLSLQILRIVEDVEYDNKVRMEAKHKFNTYFKDFELAMRGKEHKEYLFDVIRKKDGSLEIQYGQGVSMEDRGIVVVQQIICDPSIKKDTFVAEIAPRKGTITITAMTSTIPTKDNLVSFMGMVRRKIKSVFVHEYTHYVDYIRSEGRALDYGGGKRSTDMSTATYYNDPMEFNAWYQGAIVDWYQEIVDKLPNKKEWKDSDKVNEFLAYIGLGRNQNFDEFKDKFLEFSTGYKERIKYLRKDRYKRFVNRLYQFYQNLKEREAMAVLYLIDAYKK